MARYVGPVKRERRGIGDEECDEGDGVVGVDHAIAVSSAHMPSTPECEAWPPSHPSVPTSFAR